MLKICDSIGEISTYLGSADADANVNANAKYDHIYISFGSKYNQEFIYMTDRKGKQHTKWSNATEQIIPYFYREKENSLIICIDCFTPNELEKNIIKVNEIPLLPSNHIILYNSKATIQSIEEFMSYITNYFIQNEIPTEKLFIANYVRFISPNHTENYFEENIPKVIYKYLSHGSKKESYNNRFYQWFGYQNHTYNLLFNYNNYRHMIGYTNILFLLNAVYDEDCLSHNNLYMIQESGSSNKTSVKYLEIFLKNVIDITGFFEISLYDYFPK